MSRPSLDWSDPIAVSTWLSALRLSFNDADAVALDMLRPPRARELGPAIHAQNYREARAQIVQALDYAALALALSSGCLRQAIGTPPPAVAHDFIRRTSAPAAK